MIGICFVWGLILYFLFFLGYVLNWAGKLECCHNSNVASIWVELVDGRIGSVLILLGLCVESIAWGLASQDIWWQVSYLRQHKFFGT